MVERKRELMSRAVRRPVGIAGTLVVLVGLMWVFRREDVPWWVYPALLGALALGMILFAVRAAHTPSHDRFVHDQRWSTSLSLTEALQRIADHWESRGMLVHRGPQEVRVELGSDFKLRFSGIHSRRGKQAFPSVLTVTGNATDDGAELYARCRDNLGWYPLMHSSMRQVASERNELLVETCRQLSSEIEGDRTV